MNLIKKAPPLVSIDAYVVQMVKLLLFIKCKQLTEKTYSISLLTLKNHNCAEIMSCYQTNKKGLNYDYLIGTLRINTYLL